MNEEHKRKISDSLKGNTNNLGHKNSEEAKRKIGLASKGHTHRLGSKHSEKTKLKMSVSHRGEKGSNWKGGITPLVRLIRTCFKYKAWAIEVFKRDEYTCQESCIRGCILNAHHIKHFSIILEENNIKNLTEAIQCDELWDINNGITLSEKEHKRLHKNE